MYLQIIIMQGYSYMLIFFRKMILSYLAILFIINYLGSSNFCIIITLQTLDMLINFTILTHYMPPLMAKHISSLIEKKNYYVYFFAQKVMYQDISLPIISNISITTCSPSLKMETNGLYRNYESKNCIVLVLLANIGINDGKLTI